MRLFLSQQSTRSRTVIHTYIDKCILGHEVSNPVAVEDVLTPLDGNAVKKTHGFFVIIRIKSYLLLPFWKQITESNCFRDLLVPYMYSRDLRYQVKGQATMLISAQGRHRELNWYH
jgi:hypothetical protein